MTRTSMSQRSSLVKSSEMEDLQIGGGKSSKDDTAENSVTFDIEWLDLSRTTIEEKETKIMARALESNRVFNLKVLFLHKNAGDVGMRSMLNALTLGYLRGLEKLILWEVSSYDQITTAEEGTDTIADALEKGKVPDLHTLDLTGSLPKLIAPRGWKNVFGDLARCSAGSGRLKKCSDTCFGCLCSKTNRTPYKSLDCVCCQFFKVSVYSGDDGVRKIVQALRKHPLTCLKVLNLGNNYIGDKGAAALAHLLADGGLPQLEELDLQSNPVGEKGAEEIVKAFLHNPLLTVRVTMDWTSLLLKERANAFRECNIRLEHRLDELKIEVELDKISDLFEWRPEYCLQRPPSYTEGYKRPHMLYMLCQAPGHDADHAEDAPPQGEGIQIRRRSCFGTASRKYVARELQEEKLIEGEPPKSSEKSPSEVLSSGSNRGSGNVQGAGPSAYQTLPITGNASSNRGSRHFRGSVRFRRAPTPNAGSSQTSSSRSHLEDEKSLKRHKGVNHIYITAGSCGFIGAAKALGVETKKGCLRSAYSFIRKTFQHQTKTQRHIDSIMQELLILADRKPHEFHEMFNLRRVLLKDGEMYYPAYVCFDCFSRLEKSNDFMEPVIHKTLLEVKPIFSGQQQNSPASSPSVRRHRKHFPKDKYSKQRSRLR